MRRSVLAGFVALCLAGVAAPALAAPAPQGKRGKVATGPAPGAPGKGRSAVVPQAAAGQDTAQTAAAKREAAAKRAAAEMARLPPALRDEMREVNAFEKQAAEYRQEVQLLVERKYKRKRASLAASYEKAIENLEVLERKDRLDAIAQFEEFLSRYPHESDYTPAAMMRLAELYYEKTEDEYQIAEKAYYKKLDNLPADQRSKVPPLPPKRYEKPIALYQKVITEFPRYQYVDGAYYLLGYLLGEQDEHDAELATFHTLVSKFPKSKFVPEVWLRIGEFYFDADQSVYPDALQKAIAAYKKVLPYKHHPLYDKVLYKLGWTYYRVNDFDDAVNTFSDLLAFYQAKAKKDGEKKVGGDLRAEAIQYTAISFADDKWGSFEKAKQFFADRGHPALRAGGDAPPRRRLLRPHQDRRRGEAPTATCSRAIPTATTPRRSRRRSSPPTPATGSSRRPSPPRRCWSRTTRWARPGTRSTRTTPRSWPRRASSPRTASAPAPSSTTSRPRSTGRRARSSSPSPSTSSRRRPTGSISSLYPNAKDRYDFEYYYADTLYNSAQFQQAAKYFGRVRDSNVDNTYLEDAALGAVLSWNKEIEGEEAAGKLTKRPVVTSKNWPADKKVVAEKIPQVELSYVAAADAYVKRLPHGDRAPNVAYKAGEVFYVYGHHAEARKRFEQVVERWPKAEAAQYAANLIIETYLIAKNWKAVEETSAKLLSSAAIKNAGGQVAATFNQFKLGGRFKRAQQLFDAGKLREGGGALPQAGQGGAPLQVRGQGRLQRRRLLREGPALRERPEALPEGLPGLPEERAGGSGALPGGLQRRAGLRLRQGGGALPLPGPGLPPVPAAPGGPPERGHPPLPHPALRPGSEAVRALRPDVPQGRPDPTAACCSPPRAREKQGDPRGAIQAYQEFIRRYRHDTASASKVVDAELKTAKAYATLHESRRAQAAYHATVNLFAALQPKLEGDDNALAEASDHAAEAQFMIAEAAFKNYDAIKIVAHGRGKRFQRSLKHVIDRQEDRGQEGQRPLQGGLPVRAPGVDPRRRLPPRLRPRPLRQRAPRGPGAPGAQAPRATSTSTPTRTSSRRSPSPSRTRR